jgi:hypothetical protein
MQLESADVVSLLLISFTIVYDLTSRVDLPKYPKTIWQTLSSPFQNFLELEDLEEPVGDEARRSRIKVICLVVLGLLQGAGFLAYFVYTTVVFERDATVSLLISLAWVRVLLLMGHLWNLTACPRDIHL